MMTFEEIDALAHTEERTSSTTDALKSAREQVQKLEAELLQDITEKAALLGYEVVEGTTIPSPLGPQRPKRKRRTKAEIETDTAAAGGA